MVAAMCNELTQDRVEESSEQPKIQDGRTNGVVLDAEQGDATSETKSDCAPSHSETSKQTENIKGVKSFDVTIIRRSLDQVCRQSS
ncbi:unnamed protein product [Ilex paraguariensis]|uniref:Uncharacterized protein n=1 Tax=Ilex paraguariensis TaxID=185542 RepID=A0ABC8SE67_9AQUA